jgi:hypothetical protein
MLVSTVAMLSCVAPAWRWYSVLSVVTVVQTPVVPAPEEVEDAVMRVSEPVEETK